MATPCPAPDERSRKIVAIVFQRLSSVGQSRLAESLGVSEATISRWKAEQVEQCARALSALGLKVVPETVRCFNPKKIDAILELAKAHLEGINGSEGLEWDE